MQAAIWNTFKKYPLYCFLMIHFVIWSTLPMFRIGAPMDSMEAIWWGKFCFWGTNKHPPLSGFPAYAYYLLFAESTKSVYVLSQSCVLVGFIYIYKLASLLLEKEKAILATMLLEGVIFYNYCSPEYNVNVLSLAIWPANAYYFYRAVTENKTSCWVLTGGISALNVLNKYVSGLQLLAMGLYLCLTQMGRKHLKNYKPYIALVVFVAIVIPHFYWLYEHDFFVMEYFATRSIDSKGIEKLTILKHIIYPLKFFFAMLLYSGITLLIFKYVLHPIKFKKTVKDKSFLFFMGVFPLLFILFFSFITGEHIKSMWGYPILYMLGIILFSFFEVRLNAQVIEKTEKAVYITMLFLATIYGCILLFNPSPKYKLNGEMFAAEYTKLWQQETSRPLKYVIGDVWLVSTVVLESKDKPAPVIWGEPRRNPWIDEKDFYKEGALVIAEHEGEYEKYLELYPNKITPKKEVVLELKNVFGKTKKKIISYGFLQGKIDD